MIKQILLISFAIIIFSFNFSNTAIAQTVPCTTFSICPQADACGFYNETYKNNEGLFEDVVRGDGNYIVKTHCEWQVGIVLLDGTIVEEEQ